MTRIFSFLVLVLLTSCGCSPTLPNLEPRLAYQSTPSAGEMLRASNVIVLATVSSQNITGPTARIANNESVRLEKIDLDVEGVLKGKIDTSKISFYRYRWYEDWPKQSPAIDAIAVGNRSVFFLDRTAKGQLRAAFDVTVSRVAIMTGRHDLSRLSSRPVQEQIAYLMLTPGSNISLDQFGQSIGQEALEAMTLVGQTGTLDLLKPLLENSSNLIRTKACLTMAQFFSGQYKCLTNLSDDTRPLGAKGIQSLMVENQHRDALLRKNLEMGKTQDLTPYTVRANAGGLCDYLRVMTAHQDPEIARLAAGVLEKEFPDSVRSGCPAMF